MYKVGSLTYMLEGDITILGVLSHVNSVSNISQLHVLLFSIKQNFTAKASNLISILSSCKAKGLGREHLSEKENNKKIGTHNLEEVHVGQKHQIW